MGWLPSSCQLIQAKIYIELQYIYIRLRILSESLVGDSVVFEMAMIAQHHVSLFLMRILHMEVGVGILDPANGAGF